MAKERIDISAGFRQAVRRAAEILGGGGVVVFPTETVYGIGVCAGSAEAFAKLRELKRRDDAKPFQYLVSGVDMAERLGAVFSPKARKLAAAFWPGPVTIVVPNGSGSGTIGVRAPDSTFFLAVLRELDTAVAASSANPAGAPPPRDAAAADAFGDAVDLVADGGPIIDGTPSTVVRCGEKDYEILRRGAMADSALDSAWRG